ncbi:MAG: DUF4411 family protein [Clostridia bacterium]|nr:DUF4411 family protein [Clostridia bacterium]
MECPVYVLDSNVFIQAVRQYYAFDLVPDFWEGLIWHANEGRIQSIDRVRKELEKGKDELWSWVRDHFSHAFASTDDEDVIRVYRDIMGWAQRQPRFTSAARSGFANGADAWLVAYAKARECVVVTHETSDPKSKTRVKIPDVCDAFGVPFTNTFDMLRELGGLGNQVAATSDDL